MEYNEGFFKLDYEDIEEIIFYYDLDINTILNIESRVSYLGKSLITNIDDYKDLVYKVISEYCTSKLIESQNNEILNITDNSNPEYVSYINENELLKELIIERVLNIQSYDEVRPMSLDEIVLKELKRKYSHNIKVKKLINNKKRHF